jgi:hypothetical protein
MASLIDSTKPTTGQALTADVRQNFQHAKDEIEALQDTVTSSFADLAAFPVTGLANKIYIALDTDIAYYWDGAAYVAFAAGSVVGAVMFNVAQSLTGPQKAQARSNIDAARVGVSGIVFIGAMNVSALPVLGPTDRAIAIADDAVWSGGTGCIVRWNGSAWRDLDGNVASVSINPAIILSISAGKLTRSSIAANVQTISEDPSNAYGSVNSGAAGANQFTKLIEFTWTGGSRLSASIEIIGVGNANNSGDQGVLYVKANWSGAPGISPTVNILYNGLALIAPHTRFIAVIEQVSPTPIVGIYYQFVSNSERIHYRPNIESRVGSALLVSYLELQPVIPTLPSGTQVVASKANPDHLHSSSSISDFTEAVQDVVGAFATDSTFINVVYDDLTNTILWTLIDETITEQKLNTLLAAKVNGNHNHTASQLTDFAESVDDRVAALIQAGGNITLTYDDVLNTLTIAATAPAPGAGGSPGQLQFNDAGALAGADKVDVDTDGNLTMDTAYGAVAAPSADKVKIFGRKAGGRGMLAIEGPSGLDTILQPHIGRNKIATWIPAGNSTTITADGAAALTATGTATAASVAVTNRHTLMRRLEYLVTTAAATAVAGFRSTVAQFLRGSNAGDGGFHYVCRFGPATGVATATNRAFVGMGVSTAAPTDVEPSSIVNILGMGWDAADTNIQFMHNDASGAATKIDLGASFPKPTADRTKAYELAMFCAPAGTEIFYEVTDLATGDKATGSVTTDIPAATQLLAPRGWMSVGGTSSVIGIALMGLYIETDY